MPVQILHKYAVEEREASPSYYLFIFLYSIDFDLARFRDMLFSFV